MMAKTASGRRLVVLHVLVVSLLLTLGGRLYYLQIHEGQHYAQAAASNRIRQVITPAPRGDIVDRNGVKLVTNTTSLVVSVSRTELNKQPDGGRQLLTSLAYLLGKPVDEISGRTKLCGESGAPPAPRCWNGSPYQPIPVAVDATAQMALQVLERREQFPGVSAQLTAVRNYPHPGRVNAAHLLGYVGPITEQELQRRREQAAAELEQAGTALGDQARALSISQQVRGTDLVGRAGLEREYENDIRGSAGVRSLAVDHDGNVTGTVDEVDPVSGNTVVTSIDARLQAAAEQELAAAIHTARSKRDPVTGRHFAADAGAVVVLDVTNGQVMAMASYPTYDPQVWVGGISSEQYAQITGEQANYPMISRATQGQYAPASTFKVVTLPAAIQRGGYPIDARYDCTGSYSIPGRTINNYESRAYGLISLEKAINVSCDTIFYRWAYEMYQREGGMFVPPNPEGDPQSAQQASEQADQRDAMLETAASFGVGQPTGVDLPDEASGRIPGREWKLNYWRNTRDSNCAAARTGYPAIAASDPARAGYLQQLARENCDQGNVYRPGDAVNFSIGQGDVLTTPLQMTRVYAAIANGGTLWAPQVARAVVTPEGQLVRALAPHAQASVKLRPQVLRLLQESLASTTVRGTSSGAFGKANFPLWRIPVASKTGTAEVYGKQSTSWLASYAPANKPRYAVLAMVSQGGTGATTAAPLAAKIYQHMFGVDGQGVVHSDRAITPLNGPSQALPHSPPAAPTPSSSGETIGRDSGPITTQSFPTPGGDVLGDRPRRPVSRGQR